MPAAMPYPVLLPEPVNVWMGLFGPVCDPLAPGLYEPIVLDGTKDEAPVWPATGVGAAGPAGGVVSGSAGTRPTPWAWVCAG